VEGNAADQEDDRAKRYNGPQRLQGRDDVEFHEDHEGVHHDHQEDVKWQGPAKELSYEGRLVGGICEGARERVHCDASLRSCEKWVVLEPIRKPFWIAERSNIKLVVFVAVKIHLQSGVAHGQLRYHFIH